MASLDPRAILLGSVLWFSATAASFAHLDATRESLSQLFLGADVVAIARIDSVAERRITVEDRATVYEVVVASVATRYKGKARSRIEFFQDGHGHAYYRPGDTAALFLQQLHDKHPLFAIGQSAGIDYVSHQVSNTAHQLTPGDMKDYDWVLQAYAELSTATVPDAQQQALKIKQIIVRMMSADSPDMTESALLDWENLGSGIQLDEADLRQLLAMTRDAGRPINLRLAILRAMARRDLVTPDAWVYLFEHEKDGDLIPVVRSTQGYESRDFQPHILKLLDHPTEDMREVAARALGHPVYSGAEASLEPLLNHEKPRLNYAAVSALLGIDSPQARALLQDAAGNHPNEKLRRMVAARLATVSCSSAC